jgi:hypothetical protein
VYTSLGCARDSLLTAGLRGIGRASLLGGRGLSSFALGVTGIPANRDSNCPNSEQFSSVDSTTVGAMIVEDADDVRIVDSVVRKCYTAGVPGFVQCGEVAGRGQCRLGDAGHRGVLVDELRVGEV